MTVANQPGLLDRIESLPPLPAVVYRTLSVTNSPMSSVDDVARVLSEDQAITAQILRVANSSFYGAERRITQVSRAVVMLGHVAIRNLVLGIASRDAFRSPAAQVPEHRTLWQHSIATAASSELIACQVGYKPSEEAFTAGLLHDIGQLAMVAFEPESFRAVFREQGDGVRFLSREQSQFGVDHTEAGFQILSRWGLPSAICQVSLHHHQPQLDAHDPAARLLAIVMLADTIAHLMGFGFDISVSTLTRAEAAAEFLNFGDAEQMRISDALHCRINQAVEMFASADPPRQQRKSAAEKRALWVSTEGTRHFGIRQLVLEHHGYDVLCVSPDQLGDGLSPNDLAILAPFEERAATELAAELIRQGHRRIVLVSHPRDGVVLRQRDRETGVCVIPRLFTAFDIRWVEEQLRA